MFTNMVLQSPKSKNYIAYFICLDNFATRLSSYAGFVYEDLQRKNSLILAKSYANLIYLRGCLESTLIINILLNNYEYADKFMDNRNADIVHINNIYKTSAPNREKNYKDFYEEKLDEIYKFERRYSWLPKYKKKTPFNMSDLLNYVKVEEEMQKEFFSFFIRFFDNYSHPSFYIPSLFNANIISNFEDIHNLFKQGGIINVCIDCINQSLESFFSNSRYLNGIRFLKVLTKNDFKEDMISSISSFKELTEKLFNSDIIDYSDAALFFIRRMDIEKFVFGRISSYPHYLLQNNLGLSLLVSAIKKNTGLNSHKAHCLYLLLQDASLRLADFNRSFYDNNYDSFYIQSRYLIEFLVTSMILLKDNEERAKIYLIHQEIKGYQSKKNYNDYLSKYANTEEVKQLVLEAEKKHLENIEFIKKYYFDTFNIDVNDTTILRLNGWALFLPQLNNEDNLNFPSLIQYAIKNVIMEIGAKIANEEYQEIIETVDFVQGFYEEACAYSHITPYSWHNNLKLYEANNIFKEQYAITNSLLNQLFHGIIQTFNIQQDLEFYEKISNTLLKGMESLLQDLLKIKY